VVGEHTASSGAIDAFVKLARGAFRTIAVPGATETVAAGVDDNDTVADGHDHFRQTTPAAG
jgi:hypothetical protein